MKNRKIMFITILLLTIGFAAVSTSLIINGNISFNTNEDDFDVYFSSAVVDNEDYTNEIISEDKQSITYETKNLSFIGDASVLEYEVTNASKNYDAEVKVTCTAVSEEITLTHTSETQVIPATDIGNGKVEIKLNKTVVDEKEIAFTCTLNINAVERTTLGSNDITNLNSYVIEGNYVDENGNAIANANLVIFSSTPHYVTTDEEGYLFYNGLERGSHEIYHVEDTLENIKSMTKDEIISNAKTSAKFTTKTDGNIEFSNSSELINSEVITSTEYCKPFIGKTWEFDYANKEETFSTICAGTYKLETWGAQGGTYSVLTGGYGGYSIGNIDLEFDSILYVNVGGAGKATGAHTTQKGGYNGGGSAVIDSDSNTRQSSGGGATHIALKSGVLSSLKNDTDHILIVSGGGGGIGFNYANGTGVAKVSFSGGGYIGDGTTSAGGEWAAHASGGTQEKGGTYHASNCVKNYCSTGSFGKGASGIYSGAGGGYYGGGVSFNKGGGGSGYIANPQLKDKAMYCYSCDESEDIDTFTKAIECIESTPTEKCAKKGNGFAKITLISID